MSLLSETFSNVGSFTSVTSTNGSFGNVNANVSTLGELASSFGYFENLVGNNVIIQGNLVVNQITTDPNETNMTFNKQIYQNLHPGPS